MNVAAPLRLPTNYCEPSWDDEMRSEVLAQTGIELDIRYPAWEQLQDRNRFGDLLTEVRPRAIELAEQKLASIKRAKADPDGPALFEKFMFGRSPFKARAPSDREEHVLVPEKLKPALCSGASKRTTYWVEDEPLNPQIDWLLDETLQRGGIGFLGGPSGAGKTFVLVHLALCGALKKLFFGRSVPKPFGTYLIAAEGAASVAQRVKTAAVHSFGLPNEDATRLPIAYYKGAPDIMNKQGLDALISELKSADREMVSRYGVPLGLVQIDTFGQAFTLDDENAAAQVNRATKIMHAITDATGVAALATHHFGHSAQRLRGSSALRANSDFVIEARGDGELFLEKCRDAAEVRLGWYDMPLVELGHKADGRPITSRHIRELGERNSRTARAATGFVPPAGCADFEMAFKAVATASEDGSRLEASTAAVKATFYAAREGKQAAKRQAWKRNADKARALGYELSDTLISKPAKA